SEREWAQLASRHVEREWILREHIEIPNAKWHPISFSPTDDPLFDGFDGIHDVAGDKSLILLPTPGHTVGSLSMLIRRDGWSPILLVGDVTYEAGLLQSDTVPGTGDPTELRASYAKIRQLRERLPDLVIVPSHDEGAAGNLEHAMNGRS
ncbi:MAG: MBL fold metallo-hydrolase, partial [Hyphomicrobiales bacterium]|nr:MBL fold metallo-hydrolase [Hyphomicrobiales bacterium]